MTDGDAGSWTATTSGRERIRAVVETLDGPTTVQEIADEADVSRTTADDELTQLAANGRVREVLADGKKGYDLDPTALFFDELRTLIDEQSRSELEAKLERLERERENVRTEFGVESVSALRAEVAEDESLSATEIRELRNAATTLETLDAESSLVRHALRLYDDVSDLRADGTDRSRSTS
jgi:biotin operon repressor